mmetsp:Transcript_17355/g.47903  ORF Transcript_17355/g.47903 Transcript_17355/m.47903 type:complete len:221 (+) Transcript_17355:549-1211(+)
MRRNPPLPQSVKEPERIPDGALHRTLPIGFQLRQVHVVLEIKVVYNVVVDRIVEQLFRQRSLDERCVDVQLDDHKVVPRELLQDGVQRIELVSRCGIDTDVDPVVPGHVFFRQQCFKDLLGLGKGDFESVDVVKEHSESFVLFQEFHHRYLGSRVKGQRGSHVDKDSSGGRCQLATRVLEIVDQVVEVHEGLLLFPGFADFVVAHRREEGLEVATLGCVR